MVDNQSGFPHLLFEKRGYRGKPFDVLVIRGTFDFSSNGNPMPRAARQEPIQYGDSLIGPAAHDPIRALLKTDGDLLLGKPATDIHMTGQACCEEGKTLRDWVMGLRIGRTEKFLHLLGPRRFEKTPLGWRSSTSERTDRVALDYRQAFGGVFSVKDANDRWQHLYKPDNPVGCGWLPDDTDLERLEKTERRAMEKQIGHIRSLPAPQIGDAQKPIASPYSRHPVEGTGPIARWWEPRLSLAGTLDAGWRAQQHPVIPDDFDMRFYQSAHPDLIYPGYLEGDEELVLLGCLAEGRTHMRLPALGILLAVAKREGPTTLTWPRLDTLALDLDTRRASLTWRLPFGRDNPVRRIGIAAIGMDAWRRTVGQEAPHV